MIIFFNKNPYIEPNREIFIGKSFDLYRCHEQYYRDKKVFKRKKSLNKRVKIPKKGRILRATAYSSRTDF